MKKVIFLIFCIACLSSCVKQMEEPESAKISGMWAVVDENNMTNQYYTIENGYLTEFTSERACYVADNHIWGVGRSTFKQKMKSKYSLINGVLHYGSNDVKVIVEDGVMTLGAIKCLHIDGLNSSYYSEIVLSKNNKTSFLYSDREIVWDYAIENPVDGFNLTVKEAPEWCGGTKGVTIEADKICFAIQSTIESVSGTFVLSYPLAEDVKVEVEQSAAQIILGDTSATHNHASASGEFTYTIPNKQEGYELEIKADVDWIVDIKDHGDKVTYSILENNGVSARVGKIELTYAGVGGKIIVTQYSAPVNLAQNGTANCYIVSEAGTFSYPLRKGNSSDSITAYSLEVLWESFGTNVTPLSGDLVKSVSVINDVVFFSTNDVFRTGNAVIAAKDAGGKILWSWHIWFTDQPEEHVYANGAGILMDRNLGATSAKKGSSLAYGLYYQWGRKDPFPGPDALNSTVCAASTVPWPSGYYVDSTIDIIQHTIENPMAFIGEFSHNYDWLYSSDWHVDHSRWSSTKTMYDPCPPGWRVPDMDVWKNSGMDGQRYSFDSIDCGVVVGSPYCNSSAWYPAGGFYYDRIYKVGVDVYAWSVSKGSNFMEKAEGSDVFSISSDGKNYELTRFGYHAYGRPVRCSRE